MLKQLNLDTFAQVRYFQFLTIALTIHSAGLIAETSSLGLEFRFNQVTEDAIIQEAERRKNRYEILGEQQKSVRRIFLERNSRIRCLIEQILLARSALIAQNEQLIEDMEAELYELLEQTMRPNLGPQIQPSDKLVLDGRIEIQKHSPSQSTYLIPIIRVLDRIEENGDIDRSDSPLSSLVSSGLASETVLESNFEIKRIWVQNEWHEKSQFSSMIREIIPDESIFGSQIEEDRQLIECVFNNYRGVFRSARNRIWGLKRENAEWRKIVVDNLELEWALKNIEICYHKKIDFELSKLDGLVLWREPNEKKYRLLEGNHRISAWNRSKTPTTLPALIFVGKSKLKRCRNSQNLYLDLFETVEDVFKRQ